MGDLDLLTEIHTDVRYIKETLAGHISEDKKIQQDYLKPLWENHQQRAGAAKLAGALYAVISGVVALVVSWIAGKHL